SSSSSLSTSCEQKISSISLLFKTMNHGFGLIKQVNMSNRPMLKVQIVRMFFQDWGSTYKSYLELVKELKTNFFQFIFGSMADKQKVFSGINWVYENQYLILAEWEEGLNEWHSKFEELRLWVQVSDVPINWLSQEVGLKIGKMFKQTKNVSVVKAGGQRGSFFRLLVVVDISKPLPRIANLKLNNTQVRARFQYERLINTCYYCGIIGHLERHCSKQMEDIEKGTLRGGQYGDWLRAMEGGLKSNTSFSYGSQSTEFPTAEPEYSEGTKEDTPIHKSAGSGVQMQKGKETSDAKTTEHMEGAQIVSGEQLLALALIPESDHSLDLALHHSAETFIGSEQAHMIETVTEINMIEAQKRKGWKRLSKAANGEPTQPVIDPQDPSDIITRMRKRSASIKNNYIKSVCNNIGFRDRWFAVEPQGLRGGMLVLWSSEVVVKQIISNHFCIQLEVEGIGEVDPIWIVFVYASTDKNERMRQWNFLEVARCSWGKKWILGGDWNETCDPSEKKGGRVKSAGELFHFNNFIANMGMQELKLSGHNFTWENCRSEEGYIEEQIDKIFVSFDWLVDHLNVEVQNIFRSSFDHRLLALNDNPSSQEHRHKRFFFDKRWLKRDGIQEVVQNSWQSEQAGTPMYQVSEKIKSTRLALLKWSSSFRQNQLKAKVLLNEKLDEMSKLGANRDWEEWGLLNKELDRVTRDEEEYWAQKSRSQWIKEGDSNTKFFHALTLQRRRLNAITRLLDDNNQMLEDKEDIQQHICQFYKQLFSTEGQKVNMSKSSIFFSKNCLDNSKFEICQILGGIQIHRSTKYLGLPLGIGRSKKDSFDY
ncbi:Unknown protein, partial [Striga hermonthica]